MFKRLLTYGAITFSIASGIFTFVPESVFGSITLCESLSANWNIILNRLLLTVAVFVVVYIIGVIYRSFRRRLVIKGHGYSIVVEYGDILEKKDCKRVINFDECFSTKVGEAVQDIKPSSICGQYLSKHPIDDITMNNLIAEAKLKPCRGKSLCQNKTKYEPGSIVPNGDDLLMAFAQLDEGGRGCFTRVQYIDCLSNLWNEIDKYYCQKDVCIPILGSGITRFDDKMLTQQELLDIIIGSYKLNPIKIKTPAKLRIVCKKSDSFSINKIGDSL